MLAGMVRAYAERMTPVTSARRRSRATGASNDRSRPWPAAPRAASAAWAEPRLGAAPLVSRLWARGARPERGIARAEGEALFEVVSGFVHSQVLLALVELRVLHLLADAPETTRAAGAAGRAAARPDGRCCCRPGAALKLLRCKGDGRLALTARGAALPDRAGAGGDGAPPPGALPRSGRSGGVLPRRDRDRNWPVLALCLWRRRRESTRAGRGAIPT